LEAKVLVKTPKVAHDAYAGLEYGAIFDENALGRGYEIARRVALKEAYVEHSDLDDGYVLLQRRGRWPRIYPFLVISHNELL
jgi:hypothetical protein